MNKIKMCFNIKIILIFGVIFTLVHLPTSQGSSGCDRLEEKLNLNKAEKSRFHLNKCGGIHNRPSPSNISGPRDKVKRFEITKVSL